MGEIPGKNNSNDFSMNWKNVAYENNCSKFNFHGWVEHLKIGSSLW